MSNLIARFRKYVEEEQELPRVFHRDRKKIKELRAEWDTLWRLALKAEGSRIWQRKED